MQKSSFRACFPSIIHSVSLEMCGICRICKFLEIYGFNAFCVRCILRVFSPNTHNCSKICIFIKNTGFCKNSYFPNFCEFCPSIFHKKMIVTPRKTTYFARSAQKWRAQKMGIKELRYLAEICVKIMFLGMFFFNYLHSEPGTGHIRTIVVPSRIYIYTDHRCAV